jgi:hypothetical protein
VTSSSALPPEADEATFGHVTTPDDDGLEGPVVDFGDHGDDLRELISRAASLTPLQVRQLAAAAAWRWVPLGLPSAGTVAGARAAALVAGRSSGREQAIDAAQLAVRQAALDSTGGRATRRGWSGAETVLAALVIGTIGAVVSANVGATVISIGFVIMAVVGGVLLLFLESSYVRRLRLVQVVSTAALATVTRDVIEPEAYELLAGPWLSVMRD